MHKTGNDQSDDETTPLLVQLCIVWTVKGFNKVLNFHVIKRLKKRLYIKRVRKYERGGKMVTKTISRIIDVSSEDFRALY